MKTIKIKTKEGKMDMMVIDFEETNKENVYYKVIHKTR